MGAVTMALPICDQRQHHVHPKPKFFFYRHRPRRDPPVTKELSTGAVWSKKHNLRSWNI